MRKRWVIIVAVVIALVAVFWAVGYHPSEFKGGISVRNSGFFSYPRYHARFGKLPLWKPGEYHFTVRGLPPSPLDLSLQVLDSTSANRAELISLSTKVSVSIIDSSGRKVCEGSGNLSDAETREHSTWVLASSSSRAYFWHEGCLQLSTSRFKTYIVTVKLSEVDSRSPHNMIMPTLEGGGIELP